MATGAELQFQGIALFEQSDYEAAARVFHQAEAQFTAEDRPDMVAEMKVNLGLVHRALGEHQQALDMMSEALRTFQSLDDPLRTAQVQGNMGGVYMALNDMDKAFAVYRQAADTFRDLGEKQMYAHTLLALGGLQMRAGRYFEGAATFEAAYEMLDRLTLGQKIARVMFRILHGVGRIAGFNVPGLR